MRKKFTTAAQMKEMTDMYFSDIESYNKHTGYKRPSISGLTQFLGLTKDEFLDFENKPVYKHVAKIALLKVEMDLEKRLYYDSANIEEVMDELCRDFGWLPLEESDRKQIKQLIN